MKTKIFIWVVILLLVMNISAIFTLMYQKKQETKADTEYGRNVETMQPGQSGRFSGRWFRDELNLSRDQMREFSRFNPVFRQKVRGINTELIKKRQQMLIELSNENSDTILLDELSDSIGMLHSELKKATYAYFLEFKKICTPGQQEKLLEIFNSVLAGENPAMGQVRGGRGRLGMGWRKNQVNN